MLKFCLYEPCLNMKHTLGSTEAVTLQPLFGTVTSSLRNRVTTASVFSTLRTRACTNLYSYNHKWSCFTFTLKLSGRKIAEWAWYFTLMSSNVTSLVGNSFHCPSGCFFFITGSLARFLDAQCGMAMAKGSSNCKVLIRLILLFVYYLFSLIIIKKKQAKEFTSEQNLLCNSARTLRIEPWENR